MVFSDANDLGVKRLKISGGEPTLNKSLTNLIEIGRDYGWFVSLNTNGTLLTEKYAIRLLDAGFNQARVSLYSHAPEVHTTMRFRWCKCSGFIKPAK